MFSVDWPAEFAGGHGRTAGLLFLRLLALVTGSLPRAYLLTSRSIPQAIQTVSYLSRARVVARTR